MEIQERKFMLKEEIKKMVKEGKNKQVISSILGISLKATQSIIDRMVYKKELNV
jgi:hypothetical protein